MFKKENRKEKSKIQPPAMKPHLTLTLLLEFLKKRKERDKGKRKFFSFLLLVFCHLLFVHYPLLAQVPHLINFQSVLTDATGLSLSDGLHRIVFRVVDATGAELYKETQSLESVHGVVSAMVGSQGELGLTLFDPKVPKFLGVQVEGGGPETLLEIASVPYAMTAEQALSVAPQSITAEAIKLKSITADLLADDVVEKLLTGISSGGLPSVVVSREELSGQAGADAIGVASNFIYSRSSTIQDTLKDLDTAVYQRQVNMDRFRSDLNNSISQEATARSQADTNLQTQINTTNGRVDTANANINTANSNIGILQNQIIATNGRIDGAVSSISADKSAADDRLTALERSVALRPFAFGRVSSPNDGCSLSGGYNVASARRDPGRWDYCAITFSSPAPSGDYVVLVSRTGTNVGDNAPVSYNYSPNGFNIGTGEDWGNSFVVFGNF